MARRTGLGKSIDEVVAESEAALNRSGPKVPGRDAPLSSTRIGINSLISSGDDFGPYFLDPADTYYQGPSRSTRVAAHQFLPLDPVPQGRDQRIAARESALNDDQFKDYNIMGIIYVRFIKNNTLWQYGPLSLAQYKVFRESASKGRSVKSLESLAGHGAVTGQVPGLAI